MCAMRIKSQRRKRIREAETDGAEVPDPTGTGAARADVSVGSPAPPTDTSAAEVDAGIAAGVSAFLARSKDSRKDRPSAAKTAVEARIAHGGLAASPAVKVISTLVLAAAGALLALSCAPTVVSCVSEGASAVGGAAARVSQGMNARALIFGCAIDAAGHLPRLLVALAGVAGGAWPVKQAVCSLLLHQAPGAVGLRRAVKRVALLLALACVLYLVHVAAVSACSSAGVAASVDQVTAALSAPAPPAELDTAIAVG